MRAFDMQGAIKMLTLFSGAVKGMAFYPDSHPAIRKPLLELDRMLNAACAKTSGISWGIVEGAMFFEEHLFVAPSAAIADLINRMTEKEINRISVTPGLSFDELQQFVQIFSAKGMGFGETRERMKQAGITHLRVDQGGEEVPEVDEDVDIEIEAEGDYLGTYGHALDAVRAVCRDIERGRIPSSLPIIRIVDRMVGITMKDPSALLGLSMIKDYDNYTFNHCVNVGVLAMALGASIGLDSRAVKDLGIAGQLHDIGKTLISKDILNKPGKLSSTEFEEIKRHPELGHEIITKMEGLDPVIAQVVLGHHIHYNRAGYPAVARKLEATRMIDIMAIADTYDAITTLRVYQHPVTPRTALEQMQKLAGTVLNGSLVTKFTEMMGKYPVGTVVRLDTNEVAVVCRPNPLDEETPLVKVLFEANGTRLSAPREQSLVDGSGSRYAGIVAVIDPLLKNIDVGSVVAGGAY